MTFSRGYFEESLSVLRQLDYDQVDGLAEELTYVRNSGHRVFLLGIGGSAAHASHAAADFRKLCQMDAICLTDNVAAYTAAVNDTASGHGFCALLKHHRFSEGDALLVLSVGGGSVDPPVSLPLVDAIDYAHAHDVKVFGIVGRDGGHLRKRAQWSVLIPPLYPDHVTPHTEGLMSVVLHCLVSHPALQVQKPKWESLAPMAGTTDCPRCGLSVNPRHMECECGK